MLVIFRRVYTKQLRRQRRRFNCAPSIHEYSAEYSVPFDAPKTDDLVKKTIISSGRQGNRKKERERDCYYSCIFEIDISDRSIIALCLISIRIDLFRVALMANITEIVIDYDILYV